MKESNKSSNVVFILLIIILFLGVLTILNFNYATNFAFNSMNSGSNDTLQSVTDRGSVTTNQVTIQNDLFVDDLLAYNKIGLHKDNGVLQFNHEPAPIVSQSTFAVGSGSGSLTGTHTYVMTFVDEDGYESSRSRRIGETSFNSGTGVVVINDLPVSDNPRVVARHIYHGTSSQYQNRRHIISNNVDTSVTLSAQGANVGNYIFNARPSSAVEGYGGAIGGIIQNRKGEELFRISEDGQFLMNNERNTFIFYGKQSSLFPHAPFYILQGDNYENNYNFGSMFWDSNILNIGTTGRGSYSPRAVRLISEQPGVNFFLQLSRGNTGGWLSLSDSGTGVGNVDFMKLDVGKWTGSWGTNRMLIFEGEFEKSGTANYDLLYFNFKDSDATATGHRNLINMRINNQNTFTVDSEGNIDTAGDIYATDFITKSRVADFTNSQRSLDRLNNAKDWLSDDGSIDYDKHYAGISRTVQREIGTEKKLQTIENCDSEHITGRCEITAEYVDVPIYEDIEIKGLSMETRVAEMEKMIWELKQENIAMRERLDQLEGVRG